MKNSNASSRSPLPQRPPTQQRPLTRPKVRHFSIEGESLLVDTNTGYRYRIVVGALFCEHIAGLIGAKNSHQGAGFPRQGDKRMNALAEVQDRFEIAWNRREAITIGSVFAACAFENTLAWRRSLRREDSVVLIPEGGFPDLATVVHSNQDVFVVIGTFYNRYAFERDSGLPTGGRKARVEPITEAFLKDWETTGRRVAIHARLEALLADRSRWDSIPLDVLEKMEALATEALATEALATEALISEHCAAEENAGGK